MIEKSSDTSFDGQPTQSSYVVVSEEEREEEKEIDKDKDKKSVRETTHTLFKRLISDYSISSFVAEKMAEWITYKVERKEPYKEQGMKSLLRQIENNCLTYGDQAVCNLIDECMANGWKGIIFDRLKQKSSKQPNNPNSQRREPTSAEMAIETERLRRFIESMKKDEPKTAGNDDGVRQRAEALKQKLG